jgi:hypothetical protein
MLVSAKAHFPERSKPRRGARLVGWVGGIASIYKHVGINEDGTAHEPLPASDNLSLSA